MADALIRQTAPPVKNLSTSPLSPPGPTRGTLLILPPLPGFSLTNRRMEFDIGRASPYIFRFFNGKPPKL